MFGYYLDLALRSLKRNRVLTALMVIAIAVGIGTSMTTLTVMYLLSGDPLPGRSAHIYYPQLDAETGKGLVRSRPADLLDYTTARDLWSSGRADHQTLTAEALVKIQPAEAGRRPAMTEALTTTSEFFAMFDVPFRYGGAWQPGDDQGRSRIAVISESLNQQLFGGANSVGRTLRVDGNDLRIVGVLAHWRPSPRFYMVVGGHGATDTSDFYKPPQDVMMPLSTAMDFHSQFGWFSCWGHVDPKNMGSAECEWLGLWVQLDTPARRSAYQDYLRDYDAQQRSLGRFDHAPNIRMMSLMEWLDFNQVVPKDVQLQTWLAFGFLVICLCNTVGLLLVKFMGRSGEIGVRRAMGASRRDIFMQCLVEAGTVGLVGGMGGLLLAWVGLWLVRQQKVAYADVAQLDPMLLLSTIAMAIVASLLAGLLPAMRAASVPPALQIKVS
jgi:putative ABC transport system permease protein